MVRMASSRVLSGIAGVAWLTAAYACNASDPPDTPFPITAEDGGQSSDASALIEAAADDPDAQLGDAGGPVTSMVAVGAAFACALAKDGGVWCWGKNDVGQLGRDPSTTPACGSTRCSTEPVRVEGLGSAVRIAAGDD